MGSGQLAPQQIVAMHPVIPEIRHGAEARRPAVVAIEADAQVPRADQHQVAGRGRGREPAGDQVGVGHPHAQPRQVGGEQDGGQRQRRGDARGARQGRDAERSDERFDGGSHQCEQRQVVPGARRVAQDVEEQQVGRDAQD